jgi:hypothetical protein
LYQQTGEEATKSAGKMATAMQAMTVREMMGFPGTGPDADMPPVKKAKNMSTSQWQSLSADQIARLWQKPGLFTAGGVRKAVEEQRKRAFQDAPPTRTQSTEQALNVTLQMDNQEIGRLHAILQDRDQQEQRRSFSSFR